MNKKFFTALALAFTLLISLPVFAANDSDKDNSQSDNPKIEISFKVGDSDLNINGKSVKVETPYVLNGTTLVPLRVITEAFGAEVNWEDSTQKITISYKDVKIVMQIGQKNATVNTQQLDLLEAPELKNDSTMVPLRFITENFGADVTYDDVSNKITVVKENTISNSIKDYSLILKRSQKFKIGDSYWGWSMNNPKAMSLSYRSFDGRKNVFEGSAGEADFSINLSITKNTDNLNFDQLLAKEKEYIKDYTIINQSTKKGADGINYIVGQYKTKSATFYYKTTVKDENIILVELEIDNDSNNSEVKSYKKDIMDIIDSFALATSRKDDVEDLSDVENGYRVFDNKTFKLSVKVPADYDDVSDEDKINKFSFEKTDKDYILNGYMDISIYSKTEGMSLRDWANRDREYNMNMFNPELTTFTELTDMTVGGFNAVYYKYAIENVKRPQYMYDVFFENGDYGYNFTISIDKDDFSIIQEILNSIKTETLDKEEIGEIGNPDLESKPVTRTYTSDNNGFTFELPTDWENRNYSATEEVFYSSKSGAGFYVMIFDADEGPSPNEYLEALQKDITSDGGKVLESTSSVTIDGISGKMTVVKQVDKSKGSSDLILTTYALKVKNKFYVLQSIIPEEAYGTYNKNIIEEIIKTFKFNN